MHLYDITNLKSYKRLVGHKKEGYGLSWNKEKVGYLASSAEDHLICIWDINAKPDADKIEPLLILDAHQSIVGDVCFHKKQPEIFASVDDNRRVFLWDLRKGNKPISNIQGHNGEIYSIDFNPIEDNLYATGSADRSVMIWDMRKVDTNLARLENHTSDINAVQWSPHDANVLASCGNDRKVCIWDISKIGASQSKEDSEDGPAELQFVHAGHTAGVNDVSWREDSEYMLCSTSEENIIQIWQMASEIYHEDNHTPTHIDSNVK